MSHKLALLKISGVILKREVYAKDWKAGNLKQLKQKIKDCLKYMDPKLVQDLMELVPRRLDNIRRFAV